jgi:TPR repeat protein
LASAQSQDLRAQAWGNFYQGIIFLRGDYVDQDNDQAHKFLKLAAKQEVDGFLRSKAFFNLGKFYYTIGVHPQDYEMLKASRQCFLKVIHSSSRTDDLTDELAEAHLMLGWEYEDGLGVLKDYKTAYQHYEKAAAIDEKSKISLAAKIHLCDLEHNVYKNYGNALRYSEQVAQQTVHPDCRAQALLRQGSLYREGGYGIIRNAVLAYKCLTEVVNQKDDLNAAQEAQKILNCPDLRHMQSKIKSD